MLVLIAKNLNADYYYTTKNTVSVLTSSLKQAKRFKSIEEIDIYFSQDNWMFNMNWNDFYNVTALNKTAVTRSIPLDWTEYHNWIQVTIKKSFNINYNISSSLMEQIDIDVLTDEIGFSIPVINEDNTLKQATQSEIQMLLNAGLDPFMFDF